MFIFGLCFFILSFVNNRKIPFIPPLFQENHSITGFQGNGMFSKSFFSQLCSLMSNSREGPSSTNFYANKRRYTIPFSNDDLGKIIQTLNPNKAHGDFNISTRILKIRCSANCQPLELVFY